MKISTKEDVPGSELRAPYVSWDAFSQTFDRIRKRNPTSVDLEVLQQWGVSKGNAQKTLPALKFLGIIDSRGSPLPVWETLMAQDPEKYHGALEVLIRQAYAKLLEAYSGAFGESDQRLADLIGEIYGGSVSTRTAAAAFLRRLLVEAGLLKASDIGASKSARKISPHPQKQVQPTVWSEAMARKQTRESDKSIVHIHLHVGVAPNMTEAELSEIIHRFTEAASRN